MKTVVCNKESTCIGEVVFRKPLTREQVFRRFINGIHQKERKRLKIKVLTIISLVIVVLIIWRIYVG